MEQICEEDCLCGGVLLTHAFFKHCTDNAYVQVGEKVCIVYYFFLQVCIGGRYTRIIKRAGCQSGS